MSTTHTKTYSITATKVAQRIMRDVVMEAIRTAPRYAPERALYDELHGFACHAHAMEREPRRAVPYGENAPTTLGGWKEVLAAACDEYAQRVADAWIECLKAGTSLPLYVRGAHGVLEQLLDGLPGTRPVVRHDGPCIIEEEGPHGAHLALRLVARWERDHQDMVRWVDFEDVVHIIVKDE